MKNCKILVTTLATVLMLVMFPVCHAFGSAGIFNLVIDGSGSVSQDDFQKAQAATIFFIDQMHKRAQSRPGALSDWLSINFFGGDNEYQGSRFVNCSHFQEMLALAAYTARKDHPQFSNTAIYTAVAKALVEEIKHEEKLQEPEGTYVKNILLITDGKDTSSNGELKRLVQRAFPNEKANLFIIAVGSGSDVREFEQYADAVLKIDNFGQLTQAISYAMDRM